MRSTEYLITNADGIFEVRAVRRMTGNQAYAKNCIDAVNVSFRDYARYGASSVPNDSGHGMAWRTGAPPPQPSQRDYPPRGVQLRRDEIVKFGHTQGCPGSLWIETGA